MDYARVLVADKSRAMIFRAASARGDLEEVTRYEHPGGRLRSGELVSADRGRMPDAGPNHRSALEPPTDPKRHEAEVFAQSLARVLDKQRTDNAWDKLYLVAPPAFLGMLREHLSEPVRRAVVDSVDKNLTDAPPEQIREQLPWRL